MRRLAIELVVRELKRRLDGVRARAADREHTSAEEWARIYELVDKGIELMPADPPRRRYG